MHRSPNPEKYKKDIYEHFDAPGLKKLSFPEMSESWLDFIAACRAIAA